MITYDRAMEIIQASLGSLARAGLIEQEIAVQNGTVLLGQGSPLDSIAFVTFVTELEDRVSRDASQELYLVLGDIHEYNADNARLTADTMARYLVRLSAPPA